MAKRKVELISVAGREVELSNPDKVYFPVAGYTKRDLMNYYLSVSEPALRGITQRPIVLKRYVDGADQPAFYQKRAPEKRPDWIETTEISFPSGRTAEEVVIRNAAQLAWIVNLGCIDLHPHPVRAYDLDHPDELRVDLDPMPGVPWSDVCKVALKVREVLGDHGLIGWPKTSGSRGFHIWVRIERRWPFQQVRRAALALARETERRLPELTTSKWWKEERHGVFIDYNQNAKDRTTAAAWSVRPMPDARVSMPLTWDEVPTCDPEKWNIETAPKRFAEMGDPHADIDKVDGSLDTLLELSAKQEAEGQGDAPWPPHFAKGDDEAPRVAPSRAKGQRKPKVPVITISKAKLKEDAFAGLERWKEKHPGVVEKLQPADILVDTMRGRSSAWTRIRVNLQHVPEEERPAEVDPDPDYDPKVEWGG
ncbi:MAG: non-homologous end-joining DNA ligase [Deltaproteobacteria bacterium]|nr:non-homologous end-joining DNA ligase [Deltaproteobacteria bacterium]